MTNLYGVELHELETLMLSEGEKKYKAIQLYHWIYDLKAETFDEMSDLSLSFRNRLKENYSLELPKVHTKQVSNDGTIKLLVEFTDGMKVETVLMRYEYGNVACVSSQVGCNMGCSFCASGLLGKKRNLETYEMVGQIMVLNKELLKENRGQRV
ncbi:MAG: 23S rRNA (adenine(2503)-C(2))-methyltransferase RlmN, partial [Coprobacillus sp.]|nr:23S rRNA (adenine(2503)-C(2))-methyltransferase RlmN [Coprobacillus sp.]